MTVKRIFSLLAILVALSSMLSVWPEEPQRRQEITQEHEDRLTDEREMLREREQEQEQIFGWQFMTPEERKEHRYKMHSFKTKEEREAYQREHHAKMQARAREQGITLPDLPE